MLHFRLTEVRNQKAFSFVQEIVLQITTLSTVIYCICLSSIHNSISSHAGPLRYSHAPRCKLTGTHFWKVVDLNAQGRQLFASRLDLWARVFGGFLQNCPWGLSKPFKPFHHYPTERCKSLKKHKKPTLATKVSASGVPFTVVESSEASAPQRIEDRRGI